MTCLAFRPVSSHLLDGMTARFLAASIASLSLAVHAAPALAQTATATPDALLADVRYLSSDALAGRLTGTPGADTAAAYVARRFAAVGLQPAAKGWYQDFTVSSNVPTAQQAGIAGKVGRNVIGLLPGTDPARRDEIVVVGAHYDHLGGGQFSALDPERAGEPHNGADDNASGVAAIIYAASVLAKTPPARTVVFIAFSGEELGLLGSDYYVRNPAYPVERTVAMVNLDMVGRLKNNRLIVYGTATAQEFPKLLDSLNWYAGFDLKGRGDGYGPSDQSSFYAVKRPVLHLFTDLHEDYHRASDDWEKINGPGLLKVADFTAALVRAIANRTTPLTFMEQAPPAHATAPGQTRTSGYGAYLGTVPDMAGDVARGVRLSGVRAGSPAEKAGLKRDDVITRIGDHDVPDLQAMTDALRAHQPGDTVPIEIIRDGKPTTITVTFGTRGG